MRNYLLYLSALVVILSPRFSIAAPDAQPLMASESFGWQGLKVGMTFDMARSEIQRQGFKDISRDKDSANFAFIEKTTGNSRVLVLGRTKGEDTIYVGLTETDPDRVAKQHRAWSIDLTRKYGVPVSTQTEKQLTAVNYCHNSRIGVQLISNDAGVAIRYVAGGTELKLCISAPKQRDFEALLYLDRQSLSMADAGTTNSPALLSLSQSQRGNAEKGVVPLGSSLFFLDMPTSRVEEIFPQPVWRPTRILGSVSTAVTVEGKINPIVVTLHFGTSSERRLRSVSYEWQSENQQAQLQDFARLSTRLKGRFGPPVIASIGSRKVDQYCISEELGLEPLTAQLYTEGKKIYVSFGRTAGASCQNARPAASILADLAIFRIISARSDSSVNLSSEPWPEATGARSPSSSPSPEQRQASGRPAVEEISIAARRTVRGMLSGRGQLLDHVLCRAHSRLLLRQGTLKGPDREGLSILDSSLYVLAAEKAIASLRKDGATQAELSAVPKVVIEETDRALAQMAMDLAGMNPYEMAANVDKANCGELSAELIDLANRKR